MLSGRKHGRTIQNPSAIDSNELYYSLRGTSLTKEKKEWQEVEYVGGWVSEKAMSTIRDRNIRTSEARIWEILVVAILAAIGASLALQGWKSRIPSIPFLDVLTTIDEADQLVENGRVPQKGVLTSFASFAPPGLAWLMAPGVLLLKDPRLFEYIGSISLYCGTLLGIFLLARFHLGTRCALLAVLLWGLSRLGLFFASSLWPRGHPFFFVWMLYWVAKWVQANSPK